MAKKPERKMNEPESPEHAPKPKRPPFSKRHPHLAKAAKAVGTGMLALGIGCAPAARAQETTPSRPATTMLQSPDVRVAPATVPGTATSSAPPRTSETRVAQVARPGTAGYDQAAAGSASSSPNRLFDGGGAILNSGDAVPMTQQEFQEQIAYMFDLTSQFEVQPDSSGKYTTDEFVVKRSTGFADRAPYGCIAVYGKNSRDGGDSRDPLDFLPPLENNVFRVFRFQVRDSAIVQNEVVAIIDSGGVTLYYFNKTQNLYTMGGAAYGPNYFGPNPKIGLEMNEQDGVKYIGAVVIDSSKFDVQGNPIAGAEVASISLDISGPGVSGKARLGAGMYKIQE
jgi:hypothetical protein